MCPPPHKDKALRGLRALKIYNSAKHSEMQSSIEGHDDKKGTQKKQQQKLFLQWKTWIFFTDKAKRA